MAKQSERSGLPKEKIDGDIFSMTRDAVNTIITEEELVGYNFFESRPNAENEIVIKNVSDQWMVYATDERASKVTGSEKLFDNEAEALENFIKRLRAMTFLIRKP